MIESRCDFLWHLHVANATESLSGGSSCTGMTWRSGARACAAYTVHRERDMCCNGEHDADRDNLEPCTSGSVNTCDADVKTQTRLRCDRVSSFFFFFQAEDGIRDVAVTGVQTCALPI